MPVELTHIGEDLVAAILESLAHRSALNQVVCEISGRTLEQDIHEGELGDTVHFRADDANLIVRTANLAFSCDGEQKVDVLCAGDKRAIAVEAKLGVERMGSAEFRRRFCTPCEKSRHADDRISGSMVAVLERSLPFEEAYDLIAQTGNVQWQLTKPWWLVLRSCIAKKWRTGCSIPVASARIVTFEALAKLYGSKQQFDQLVRRVVGLDFSSRWGISLTDP